jgi:hypothetical protein
MLNYSWRDYGDGPQRCPDRGLPPAVGGELCRTTGVGPVAGPPERDVADYLTITAWVGWLVTRSRLKRISPGAGRLPSFAENLGRFDQEQILHLRQLRSIHVRVAAHAGRLYLDLADERWRAVEIGTEGWRMIATPPVRFRRPEGMLALPEPRQGGSIEALRPMLNLADRNDFVLVVAWLLASLRPVGPYPLLAVSGEQGSAKTVLSKLLRALIDPNTASVRALSREQRELSIAANNGHLLAFDNLSVLPAWLSDALCRLASGGSFALRRLYTDDEEVLFEAARPILLNGIEDVISRADLADRAIFLTLAPIAEEQRRSETEHWREFELARPHILGALLDALAEGLRELPRVRLERLPRMADFAHDPTVRSQRQKGTPSEPEAVEKSSTSLKLLLRRPDTAARGDRPGFSNLH